MHLSVGYVVEVCQSQPATHSPTQNWIQDNHLSSLVPLSPLSSSIFLPALSLSFCCVCVCLSLSFSLCVWLSFRSPSFPSGCSECFCCSTRVLHAYRSRVFLRKTYNILRVVHLSDSARYVRGAMSQQYF